jgi:hypothetical protein
LSSPAEAAVLGALLAAMLGAVLAAGVEQPAAIATVATTVRNLRIRNTLDALQSVLNSRQSIPPLA